ncbi:MAG: hypothetical protein IJ721_06790 [Bacteroidales bacterium]|nr:hypothetical protein [Bacteroidales bacterium]
MKKVISVCCALVLVTLGAWAQQDNAQKKDNGSWREKVRAERVAFLTAELDLTEAEAQNFWPVYNEAQKSRMEAYKASGEAYKALKEAVEAGSGDIDKLLSDYVSAKQTADAVESGSLSKFKGVLPIEKVGKLFLAEEKFRHQQIGRLGQGGPGRQGQARPGQGRKPSDRPQGERPGRRQQGGTEEVPAEV